MRTYNFVFLNVVCNVIYICTAHHTPTHIAIFKKFSNSRIVPFLILRNQPVTLFKTDILIIMFSLLSEPKVVPAPQLELVSGEQKVAMASKASRLLKTVKLMLAREKSYNVSSAEGRKRGRKQNKSAYSHRCVSVLFVPCLSAA